MTTEIKELIKKLENKIVDLEKHDVEVRKRMKRVAVEGLYNPEKDTFFTTILMEDFIKINIYREMILDLQAMNDDK